MRIDLVTVIHPEDMHRPRNKYTFRAPANSGIEKDDYVIVKIKNGETLAKVISVLVDIDESDSTMNFIRSVSSIGDKVIQPVIARLKRENITYSPIEKFCGFVEKGYLDNYLAEKKASKVQEILTRKERLASYMKIGMKYYSIEQGLDRDKGFYLYPQEYTYGECKADQIRIEDENIFFDLDEIKKIIEILMGNVDGFSQINIHHELAKIL